ncbi:hypothetical protein PAXINDRAFT_102462 [Paxillus involutus ATCC 200175]|uniref:F-box domain-containing protein n=1 Tax=Paxillus involutus ATCC 200175 TaxID=664439 RepID=A0A0C9TLW1_PAXIN|nr:hypothetical protein PAXINDRAFT_102462 [Paxillus involutus ATCC 200175]
MISVIQWSTPERRAGDRDLPILPNEIYLIIFEDIAPTSSRLSPKQLLTLSNLSRVCRFFGNICLPRIFEYIAFINFMSRYSYPPTEIPRISRARALCEQVATKEPLALSLAQCVKVCHFMGWRFASGGPGSWAVQTFSELCLSGMAHMKNISKLEFFESSVQKAHWDVITTLESLEELRFTGCNFLDGPADVDPGKRLKVKVPCLQVYEGCGNRQLAAAIDPRHLRTLTMDLAFSNQVDWLSDTALTELYVTPSDLEPALGTINRPAHVKRILSETPQSIEVLGLPVYPNLDSELLRDPAWKNIPLLRSLMLKVQRFPGMEPMTMVRIVCECVRLHKGLQSFTLQYQYLGCVVSPAEVRHMIEEQLNDLSELNFVNIYGTAVRLVDGKWIDVHAVP